MAPHTTPLQYDTTPTRVLPPFVPRVPAPHVPPHEPTLVAAPTRAAHNTVVMKAYARLDVGILMPLPPLPLSSADSVAEKVQFKSAMFSATETLRIARDDHYSTDWIHGWLQSLERHTLRAVENTAQAAPSKALIGAAFKQEGDCLRRSVRDRRCLT